MSHHESHRSQRIGWLRAAVLGSNDGIISTASLIIGVASTNTTHEHILIAGVAGLVAGAMSMAAGEYVSVSSQSDTEKADLAIEQKSLDEDYELEVKELTHIYQDRGLNSELAQQVAIKLMEHDALGAHARDEIGISESLRAQPVQAALASACTFAVGAALPLLGAWLAPIIYLVPIVAILSLFFLAVLGGVAAQVGGASIIRGATRVTFWGALAMSITAIVGNLFSVAM